jgi:sensor histidine kinase YesM
MSEKTNYRNDRMLQFITHRKFSIYRHLLFVFMLVIFILNSKDTLIEPFNAYIKIFTFFMLLFFFYFNMYFLIPRFIFKERYFAYSIWIVGLLAATMALSFVLYHYLGPYDINKFHPPLNLSRAIVFSVAFCILISSIVAIKLFQRSIVMNQRLSDLETLTIQSELEQLKNQINPHFLFNTLNNVNMLTQTDPIKASQILIRLSDLLHYQLYDSTRNQVLLTSEIRFIEDFLNLEKIRRDVFDFEVTLKGDLAGVFVPPLLFITFVENAVKHNLDSENPSYVYISFELKEEGLYFNCINSKPLVAQESKAGGLGLANVKRRLELLFPENYHLAIDDKKEQFSVVLKLNI